MHDRQKGKHVFECDGPGCSEVNETGAVDFREALDILKSDEWQAWKRDEKWEHFCPNCKR